MRRSTRAAIIGVAFAATAGLASPALSPAAAVIDGVPVGSGSSLSVGVIVTIDPETVVIDGEEVVPYKICSAVLIDELWALTEAGCVTTDEALPRYVAGDLAFDDLLYTRGYEDGGERRPDQYVYASFGPTDTKRAILGLIAHFVVDGPDIPFYPLHYPGYFAPAGTPLINPDLRAASFASGAVNDYLGSLALVPLGAVPPVDPIAFSGELDWPSQYSPALFAGYGTLETPAGSNIGFDAGIGIRRAIWTVVRSEVVPPGPGDPTAFCESTQYVIGETLCTRAIGDAGGAACFGDNGGAVISYRYDQPLLVSLIRGTRAFPAVLCGESGQLDRTTALGPAAAWITSVTGVEAVVDESECATNGAGTLYFVVDAFFFVPCWLPGGPHPFDDVHAKVDPYFAEAGIAFLFSNGITTGVSATRYAPDLPVTRGDLATLLYRFVEADDETLPPWPPHPFVDVFADYQHEPVSWMYAAHLTTGSPAGSSTFKADAGLTRAEMVTFLWRIVGSPDVPIEARFIDVVTKGSDYFAAGAIAWAAASDITTGSPAGSRFFRPDALVTRAEVATFLARFAERI